MLVYIGLYRRLHPPQWLCAQVNSVTPHLKEQGGVEGQPEWYFRFKLLYTSILLLASFRRGTTEEISTTSYCISKRWGLYITDIKSRQKIICRELLKSIEADRILDFFLKQDRIEHIRAYAHLILHTAVQDSDWRRLNFEEGKWKGCGVCCG
jgi:hypothetical protein